MHLAIYCDKFVGQSVRVELAGGAEGESIVTPPPVTGLQVL